MSVKPPERFVVAILGASARPEFHISITRARGEDVVEIRRVVAKNQPGGIQEGALRFASDAVAIPLAMISELVTALTRTSTIARQLDDNQTQNANAPTAQRSRRSNAFDNQDTEPCHCTQRAMSASPPLR